MSKTNVAPKRSRPLLLTAIGRVERETGLAKDTLRVWERRYGFPKPLRDGNGERVYPPEQVEKLRVIRRLMDGGMRPGKLVGATLAELSAAGVQVLQSVRESGLIRYACVGGPGGVAIELTQYILPARLRPLAPVLAGYNKAVHAIRRQLLRTAVGKRRSTRAA